jgi:hypothetical protein
MYRKLLFLFTVFGIAVSATVVVLQWSCLPSYCITEETNFDSIEFDFLVGMKLTAANGKR